MVRFQILSGLCLVLALGACTRKTKNDSKIALRLPEVASGLKVAQSVTSLSSQWQIADPTTSAQINCYAIAVEGPGLNGGRCFTQANVNVARPGMIAGVFAAGSNHEITVPSGSDRKIYLIGFQTDDISLCKNLDSLTTGLNPTRFSSPFILDQVTRNLDPGATVSVSLAVPSVILASSKFEECTPTSFYRPAAGDTLLTVTGISPSSGSTLGATSVTITGTGFNASTTVALGGGTCTAPVITPTSITCLTPANASGAVNVSVTRGVSISTLPAAFTYLSTPAVLTFSDVSPFSFGNVADGGTVTRPFTITNSGGVPATSVTATNLSGNYSSVGGGNCSTTIAAGASCTINIQYAPNSLAVHTSNFDVTYHDGTAPQVVEMDLSGTGAAPAVLTITDGPTYDFGDRANGSSTDHTFTVNNTGSVVVSSIAPAALSSHYSFKDGTFPGTGGDCGTTLGAGQSCDIVLTYSPTGIGSHPETLTLNYFNGAAAVGVSRSITGAGVAPATLTISETDPYDYGSRTVGSTTDRSFTITNTGGVTATALAETGLAAPFAMKGGSYPGTGGTCSTSLASLDNCSIVVTYSPSGTGLANDTIIMSYNNGVTGTTANRDVQGTGLSPAVLAISNQGYTYTITAVGGQRDVSLTVTNSGGSAASGVTEVGLASPFAMKGGSYPGIGGNCGTTIAASASCDIVVTFLPVGAGSFNDTLTLNYNDGAAAQAATNLLTGTGDGTAPSVTMTSVATSPTSWDHIPITIQFSEAVTGFTVADLTTTSGAFQEFSGSSDLYTVVLKLSTTNSSIDVGLAAAVATDPAGNSNTAAATLNFNFTLPTGSTTTLTGTGAPTARADAASVWLGSRWFLFGGVNSGVTSNQGYFYSPATDTWTMAQTTGLPAPRSHHGVATNGRQIFVWGGLDGTALGTGSTLNLTSDTWTAMSTTGAPPTPRYGHSMVWGGDKVVVWGGHDGTAVTNTGSFYNPVNDIWTGITTASGPSARQKHLGIVAGHRFIVFGGNDGTSPLGDGGILNLATSSWTATDTTNQPSAREDMSYVWTGRRVIVWGGFGTGSTFLNNGAMFDPISNTWTTLSATGDVPTGRYGAKAVWTGTHMIISGGVTAQGPSRDVYALEPYSGVWKRLRSLPELPRARHLSTWTGSRLLVWGGDNGSTAFADGSSIDPYLSGTRVRDIVMGNDHACAVDGRGNVKCWGEGGFGQLGQGNTSDLGDGPAEMGGNLLVVNVGTLRSTVKIALGESFTCALLDDFTVKCWGYNTNGNLGAGDTAHRGDGGGEMGGALLALALGEPAIDISAGDGHACAVLESGSVKCWGYNINGQVGDGTSVDKISPTLVTGLTDAVEVVGGSESTCVRTHNAVKCWGLNTSGQLGMGDTTFRAAPTEIPAFTNQPIYALSGRATTMCTLWGNDWACWGGNTSGNIGDGTTSNRLSYSTASGSPVMPLYSQGGGHACGIIGGVINCWGGGGYGQLGTDATASLSVPGTTPTAYSGNAIAVSAGEGSTCAAYEDGMVRCWGQNAAGKLGLGDAINRANTGVTYGMSSVPVLSLF